MGDSHQLMTDQSQLFLQKPIHKQTREKPCLTPQFAEQLTAAFT